MSVDPFQLLRKLEPPVRPATAPSGSRALRAPFEQQGFDELLSLVSTGAVESGRPIRNGPGADFEAELDDDQRRRLAAAADLAERAGANHAVMLIDGRGLVLDVARRELTRELGGAAGDGGGDAAGEIIDIDAAVYVAGASEDVTARDAALPAPGSGLVPPNIARHLAPAPVATDFKNTTPIRRTG